MCVAGIFALQDNTSVYGPVGAGGFRTNETRFRLEHLFELSPCRTIDSLFCCCGGLVGQTTTATNLWFFFYFLCFIIKFLDYCYIGLRCQHKSSRLYLSALHFRKITLSCTMILLWEPTFLVHSQKERTRWDYAEGQVNSIRVYVPVLPSPFTAMGNSLLVQVWRAWRYS